MKLINLSMSFGIQELFTNINLTVPSNEKVGIIGVNGAGKTTLFKIMLGLISPDEGKIIFENNERIGYLPQIINDEIPNMDITVFDFLLSARPIDKLNEELVNCYNELASSNDEKFIYNKINKLEKKLDYWDRYNYENILMQIVRGMKINDDLLLQKVNTLSGGQKSKIAFARLLYSKPEILLLDEPTNHLDPTTKEYITNYLKNYNGSVYVISHDISFLNAITSKILFIDKRTKTFELYNGNYDYFAKLHKAREDALIKEADIQNREEEKLKSIVLKYYYSSGNRKKMAQDREKKLNKLLENKIDIPRPTKNVKLKFKLNKDENNVPLRVENVSFKYPNMANNLIDNLSFDLSKGEKFLIMGENGIGKSTLLKLIISKLKPNEGNIILGKKTEIGYYAQEHELLLEEKTILENFNDSNMTTNEIRSLLGRFLFFGNDVNKKVNILSPGEKSRVSLAKLSILGANLLILDEPTNHLDPETQKIIADTFKDFPGTMLIVSHNPEFVDFLGIQRVLLLPSGKITYYTHELAQKYYNLNTK
jgi:ATP-binding cassette, subfamily F, member 3